MLFSNITIINESMEVEFDKYVLVENNWIKYIGDERPRLAINQEYDGRGKLLMSGFFNGHGHSPMSLMRGYGENMALQDWLFKKIFPFEAKLSAEAVYWGTMLTMAESARYGIVSTSDMYYFCEEMARAVVDSGAKANISRSIANPTGIPIDKLESFREMESFRENYHNFAEGRIKVDMSLHAEYTSNPETAKALAEYARSLGDTVMHVHVSETLTEHRECIERHGMTPAAYLERMGIFDIPAIAAHCVYSDDDDLEIFKNKGVTVATNPVSNMKLASGICNVQKLLDKGINVSIGTDSVASNNSLDFMEEMKVLAIGNKVKELSPTAIMPRDVLYAATVGGAKAQGRYDSGLLKEGYRADLIVVDISQPNMHPVHNIINNLVYSCSGKDVLLTMVDGNIIYNDGEYPTMDVEKIIYEAEKYTKIILERL